MASQTVYDRGIQRIQKDMTTLAQETTTLAEGATVSIVRGSHPKTGLVGTYLIAGRERTQLKMRVDDVGPGSLRQYLDLMVRQIQLERARLTEKPKNPCGTPPHTIRAFVHNMAWNDMFVFDTLDHADLNRHKGLPRTGRKVSHKAKRTNN
jgi:hypothetical protein